MPSIGVLPAVGILALLAVASVPAVAFDPSGDGSGNLGVTVIDPTATESPTPTPSPGTPTPGSSGSGSSGGPGGSGGSPTPSDPGSPDPAAVAEGGGWIVVGGVEADAHGEFNPLGGWVSASVGIANKSAADTATGEVAFRLYDPFGIPIGSEVTHTITGIAPGETQRVNARLDDLGQWPLVRVVATFTPDETEAATESMDPIAREAWVLAFPWVVLVLLILALAAGIIVALRRGSFARPGRS